MTGGPQVAVVIVNHNTAADLEVCLASLAAGGLDGVRGRVWIVDNASSDDSVPRARRHGGVEVLANSANRGFAAATNQGLRAAGFGDGSPAPVRPPDHALLLNPDTVVPPGAVAALVDHMRAEDDVGVVGPKLVLADGTLDLACRRAFPTPEVSFYRFVGLSRLFPHSPRFGQYNMTFLDPDAPADVDSVVGACMLVRGEAILVAGLLDEAFWMYGEDLDWCLRIGRAGWRVVYRPQVEVRHVKRAASRGSAKAHFEFQRAMWLFYRKHYAAGASWPVHVLVTLALALRGGPRLTREMLRDGRGPG